MLCPATAEDETICRAGIQGKGPGLPGDWKVMGYTSWPFLARKSTVQPLEEVEGELE